MPRGGARKERNGPERRCIVTGESGPKAPLIRFVLGPDGAPVPDLAEKLPGRGMWLTATRAAAEAAVKKRAFARAARAPVETPPDLPDILHRLLAERAVQAVSLARKAGLAVAGFEKVKARLQSGPAGALYEASDGSGAQRAKLRPMAGDAPIVAVLTADELGLAFGRASVIHAALDSGGAALRALRESQRLSGFRAGPDAAGGAANDQTFSPDDPVRH
ncbi:MAG: RNA-binding protein [Pseudomonadota bacterium]